MFACPESQLESHPCMQTHLPGHLWFDSSFFEKFEQRWTNQRCEKVFSEKAGGSLRKTGSKAGGSLRKTGSKTGGSIYKTISKAGGSMCKTGSWAEGSICI